MDEENNASLEHRHLTAQMQESHLRVKLLDVNVPFLSQNLNALTLDFIKRQLETLFNDLTWQVCFDTGNAILFGQMCGLELAIAF